MTKNMRVVAAVIQFDGKYLACRRAPNKTAAGLWEFPGGKVEKYESDEDALVREILEELNIHISIVRHILTSVTQTQMGPIELVGYLAEATEMPTLSTDHDSIQLVDTTELHSLDWALPDLPLVRLLVSN